jgi:hypothetical protein
MQIINKWWEGVPGERFWLGITRRDGERNVLAAPCSIHTPRGFLPLIAAVNDGDIVFHYDEVQQAVVAWSTSRGRPRKRSLAWCGLPQDSDFDIDEVRLLPSWTIGLERPAPLDDVVRLDEIARTHWGLFPALRELEDRVGGPLYYPFAMDDPSSTRLLAGYVFKLPALFVESFTAMARVAEQVTHPVADRRRATVRLQPEAAPSAASLD